MTRAIVFRNLVSLGVMIRFCFVIFGSQNHGIPVITSTALRGHLTSATDAAGSGRKKVADTGLRLVGAEAGAKILFFLWRRDALENLA